VERAIELLSDLIGNSQFPATEIEKEREVVIDEINSYKDTPSELIFDEFEDLLFSGNELGHPILGEPESLQSFTSATCRSFVNDFYHPENRIFFFYGKTPFNKLLRLANKYLSQPVGVQGKKLNRITPKVNSAIQIEKNKDLHQSHVIVGGRGYSIHDEKRMGLYLLNNILGGPGMNSRLNVSLREKHGLVYDVESGLTTYTDTGAFTIYFGCDHESKDKCLKLTHKELQRLRDNKLSGSQFAAAVKQLKGQLGISCDNNEHIALGMGKSFLHFNRYDSLAELYQKIDALTPNQLLEIANEVYDEKNLFRLTFE
jgi:predicted Zn-dependent peptidase